MTLPNPKAIPIVKIKSTEEGRLVMSTQAFAGREERVQRTKVGREAPPLQSTSLGREETTTKAKMVAGERAQRPNINKDNWLRFVGDVLKFTGEVRFKSMLRIDGHFSGQVTSSDGTLIISCGAQVTDAVINVAVAKINGTVEGDICATKELVLGRTAAVTGKLTAPALTVEEGALFNGICRRK